MAATKSALEIVSPLPIDNGFAASSTAEMLSKRYAWPPAPDDKVVAVLLLVAVVPMPMPKVGAVLMLTGADVGKPVMPKPPLLLLLLYSRFR